VERTLGLRVQSASPPRCADTRRQPRQVFLNGDTEFVPCVVGALCERDRAACPQRQQTALDPVAAGDDAVRVLPPRARSESRRDCNEPSRNATRFGVPNDPSSLPSSTKSGSTRSNRSTAAVRAGLSCTRKSRVNKTTAEPCRRFSIAGRSSDTLGGPRRRCEEPRFPAPRTVSPTWVR